MIFVSLSSSSYLFYLSYPSYPCCRCGLHATAGVLPPSVVCLFSSFRPQSGTIRHPSLSLELENSGPGFTIPVNIGDLGPAIAEMNLSRCNLIGMLLQPNYAFSRKISASYFFACNTRCSRGPSESGPADQSHFAFSGRQSAHR